MSVKSKTTTTAPIKWTQAEALLKCLCADQNYNTALMCAAGFNFGLRISDILRLKWGQIMSDRFEMLEKKTGKLRRIDVNDNFKVVLKKALTTMDGTPHPDSFVFVSQVHKSFANKPISTFAANKRIKSAFAGCGIEAQNASSHTLRKTFGRRVYENNNESESALILLSKIFNHGSIAITREYIGITKELISNAYLAL